MDITDGSAARSALQKLGQSEREIYVNAVSVAAAVAVQLAADTLIAALPPEYEARILDALTARAPSICDTAVATCQRFFR